MGDGNKNFYESMSTAPLDEPIAFNSETFQKALKAMPGAVDIPLFFASTLIDPDACFKMNTENIGFYSISFDKNTKTVYVCGKNIRDALVKQGVVFQNYQPEEEKMSRFEPIVPECLILPRCSKISFDLVDKVERCLTYRDPAAIQHRCGVMDACPIKSKAITITKAKQVVKRKFKRIPQR